MPLQGTSNNDEGELTEADLGQFHFERRARPWFIAKLATLLTPLILWFRLATAKAGIPLFGDMQFPRNLSSYAANFNNMWNPHGSQSNLQEIDRLLFIQPLVTLLKLLRQDSPTTLAKVLLIGILAISGLSAFSLARYILTKYDIDPSIAAMFCAIFAISFELSPWVMYTESAYFYLVSYALTPAIMVMLLRSNQQNKWWRIHSAALGLLLAIASTSPQYTVFIFLICFVFLVWMLTTRDVRQFLWPVLLTVFTYVALSLYWLIPTLRLAATGGISPGYYLSLSDTIEFSQNASFLNVITGYSQWVVWWHFPDWWSGGWTVAWMFGSLLPFLLGAVIAVRYFRESPRIRALALSGLTLVFLAEGYRSLLWPIYKWFEFDSPLSNYLGWMIRDPWKIEGFVMLTFFVLCIEGIGFSFRKQTGISTKHSHLVLVVIASLVFLASTLPEAVYGYYFAYSPVTVPSYYQRVASYIAHHKGETLWWAPYDSGTVGPAGTVQYTWDLGRQAPFFAAESMPGTVFGSYQFTNQFEQEYQYLYSDRNYIYQKLSALGIKNLIVANDIQGASYIGNQLISQLKAARGMIFKGMMGKLAIFSLVPSDKPITPIVVIGGRASEDSLFFFHVASSTSGIVFSQQTLTNNDAAMSGLLGKSPLVLADTSFDDLVMSDLANTYAKSLVSNTKGKSNMFLGWGGTDTAANTSGLIPWHIFVTHYLNTTDNWDFDYGLGVVVSADKASMQLPFRLPPGKYVALVRSLAGRSSGTGRLVVGTQQFAIRPYRENLGMRWNVVGVVNTTSSIQNEKLMDVGGAVSINSIGFVPIAVWKHAIATTKQNLLHRETSVVVGCNGPDLAENSFYLPKGRYEVSAPKAESIYVRNERTESGAILISSGEYFELSLKIMNCSQGVAFIPLNGKPSRSALETTGQSWDPYWQYAVAGGNYKSVLEVDGTVGGALESGGKIQFRYLPNELLHEGIIASAFSTAIVLLFIFVSELITRRRRNRLRVR